MDIAIIGAGAAGLTAGIWAGRTASGGGGRPRITAFDGAKKLGAKVLVSGGGRCNVTHDVVNPEDYAGSSRNAVAKVLRTFTVEQTTAFFAELGVTLKREETGKLFPTTDRAATVLDALVNGATAAGVELLTDHRVQRVAPSGGGFVVATSQGDYTASRLILATGGMSLPKTGSDGAGYGFAKAMGHTIVPPVPALVPLVLTERHPLTTLSGIALDVTLTLASATGKAMHRQAGAMLFTHLGVSGPAPMDISRHWIRAHAEDPKVRLLCDFTNGATFEQVDAFLVAGAKARPKAALAAVLADKLPHRVGTVLCEHESVDPRTPIGKLDREGRRLMAHALTALPLPIVRDRGFLFAEVTAGGVPLSEVELATMQSRASPGLHLCGEILDVDGRIGGYNYQWAWCSSRLAGIAAANAFAPPPGAQAAPPSR